MTDDLKPGSPLSKWMLLRGIMSDPTLTPSAKAVAFWLLDHLNGQTGLCFPSYGTLAQEVACLPPRQPGESAPDTTTAKRAVKILVQRGWFTYRRGGGAKGNSNAYEPSWGRLEAVASAPPVAPVPPVSNPTTKQGVAPTPPTGSTSATCTGGVSATLIYESNPLIKSMKANDEGKTEINPEASKRPTVESHSRNEAHQRLLDFIESESPFATDILGQDELDEMLTAESAKEGDGRRMFWLWLMEHPEAEAIEQ